MNFIKCDICKKVIKGQPITIGEGYFPRFEFCPNCAESAVELMKKVDLLRKSDKKLKTLWLTTKSRPSKLYPKAVWRFPKGWLDDSG